MKWLSRAGAGLLVAAGCGAVLCAGCEEDRRANDSVERAAPTGYELRVGEAALRVEVAATPEERSRGLSGRSEVPAGTGMLFVFEEPSRQTFWMKNTYVPLTVAFLDEGGRITQMEDMAPRSEELHTSATPVRYALEVPQGWFHHVGVDVGARVEFGEELRRRLSEVSAR